jgi:ribose transport system ATP-binding protein
MTTPVLELRGITKRFAGVAALSRVNFSVLAGEIVALIGENGAGKSTLMKTLGGVHQPDEGTIHVNGHAVTIRSVNDATSNGIGFIHQELNVLDNLDVAANIYLGREPTSGGRLRVIDQQQLHADARKYLDRLGTTIPTHTLVRELPIAYQQLVEIAKALSQETRVLLMDEPTSSLTLTETQRLMAVMKDLRARGISIVYISHRLTEVQEIADRVVALRDGKNAGELACGEIDHDRMVSLMIGRDVVFRRPEATAYSTTCIEVRDLRTQSNPDSTVCFDIGAGEIVGFAGLVGAGRSEVARALFGIEPPLAGTVTLDGVALQMAAPGDAIRHGIYLVPEDRRTSGCITAMSVRENMTLASLGRFVRGGLVDFAAERASAEQLGREFSVKCADVDQRMESLSGGNQQKVILAKWLSRAARLLIFDEPTRGVDVGAKAEIYNFIHQIAARGVAIMLISSDMEEVLGESHRIIVMHEGAIAGVLGREQFSEAAIMRLAVGHPNYHPQREPAATLSS